MFIDEKCIFTGDSLVNGTTTVTRLPRGSKKDYESITLPLLRSLPKYMMVFPGHGEPVELRELIE